MAESAQAKHGKPVAAPLLHFQIEEQVERLKQEPAWVSGSRNAITLVMQPALRVVLTILKNGARLTEHHAGAPLTLQVLSGLVCFQAAGQTLEIRAGGLAVLESAIAHEIEALEESAFLLTLAQPL
jgi:quercetin dioxygenase-like cupin family protein